MNVQNFSFLKQEHFRRELFSGYCDGWEFEGESAVKAVLEDDLFATEALNDSWSSEIEEIHEEPTKTGWIDVYEREKVLKTFSYILSADKHLVVEFGSSSGYMIEEIKNTFPANEYVATDLMSDGLLQSYERNRDIMHIRCDFTDAPFSDNSVDLLFSLNVLEHIEEDTTAIEECYRILKKGAYCLFVVPHGDKLYDYFDEMLFHKRRYAKGELKRKCQNAGFTIVDNFHFAWLCYPAFWLKKKINQYVGKRLSVEEKMERVKGDIDNAMASPMAIVLMRIEHSVSRFVHPKFGVREFILLRKDEEK